MRKLENKLCSLFFGCPDVLGTKKRISHDVVQRAEWYSSWVLYETEIARFSWATHELTLFLPEQAKTRTTKSRMNALLSYGDAHYRVRVCGGVWALVDTKNTKTMYFPDDASSFRGLRIEI